MHVYLRLRRKPRLATRIPGTNVDCTPLEGGDLVQRAYTPVSMPGAVGFLNVLIKLYLPTEMRPDGGKFTRYVLTVVLTPSIVFLMAL